MMELVNERKWVTDQSTIGNLYINGEKECYLLEDPVRKKKIYGKTAIPEGRYKVVLRKAGRIHNKYMKRNDLKELGVDHQGMLHITGITKNPLLTFHYVYIHIGNNPKDTLGCPLTGTKKGKDCVISSTLAYAKMYNRVLEAFDRGEEVWFTVKNMFARKDNEI